MNNKEKCQIVVVACRSELTFKIHSGLDDYDFIVVGAGSAGSVIAARLAENINHNVLLLEAGGDPPIETEIPLLGFSNLYTHNDWQYQPKANNLSCFGTKTETCTWNKGKLFGGTHMINALFYVRGHPHDYDEWESMGNTKWSWKDVLPYFKKTEKFKGENKHKIHGTDGPMNVEAFKTPKVDQMIILEAAKELKYEKLDDYVAGPYVGFGYLYGTLKNGRRMSTAKAFLRDPKPNLHVIKNAIATKISFNKKQEAQNVEFVYKNKHKITAKVKKEIIISAGAVETPKLLMLSGIGPKVHLEALGIPVLQNLPVGDNLQDHPRAELFLKIGSKQTVESDTDLLDTVYNQWIHHMGPLGNTGLDVAGFIDTDGDNIYPEVQIAFLQVNNATEMTATLKSPIPESIIKQLGPQDRVLGLYVWLKRPKSVGLLRVQSQDYRDPPYIQPNYFEDDSDLKVLAKGIQKMIEFETTETFKSRGAKFLRLDIPECNIHEYNCTQYWRCYIKYMTGTMYHVCGSAKMGPDSDESAVVDPELRLRGVKGVRVVDASIMPKIISDNINAAAIMIAERGADFVKNTWQE